jgi:hypothetical protein
MGDAMNLEEDDIGYGDGEVWYFEPKPALKRIVEKYLVKNFYPTHRAKGLKLGTQLIAEMPHDLSKEKILYYTGVDHTRLVEENYAKNPWPNVGTVGHCDHPYSQGPYAFQSPLSYAIKQVITKL